MRMFAGPNGSGKSTIKSVIGSELLGIYINPDEIEQAIRNCDFLDLTEYGVVTASSEILSFFQNSPFLIHKNLADDAATLRFSDNKLIFHDVSVNSYFASVAADYIRHKLLAAGVTFTFETVMSSQDKIDFLRKAQEAGYRTYLYYVATEDPEINISRVENRVKAGGHPVAKGKIVSRYKRSLDFLADAVLYSNRAYIFDNSCHQKVWVAEITDGDVIELKADSMPYWFKTHLWDKFVPNEENMVEVV